MSWTIRLAESEDADALPAVERSAGMRFRSIPDLAFLADDDDRPVEWHRRHIAQGTEWVALSEAAEIVGFLAAQIIGPELHIWELAVRPDVQNQGIGRRLIEVACLLRTAGVQEGGGRSGPPSRPCELLFREMAHCAT